MPRVIARERVGMRAIFAIPAAATVRFARCVRKRVAGLTVPRNAWRDSVIGEGITFAVAAIRDRRADNKGGAT